MSNALTVKGERYAVQGAEKRLFSDFNSCSSFLFPIYASKKTLFNGLNRDHGLLDWIQLKIEYH